MSNINTSNDQLVGMQGDNIIIMLPKQKMTKEQALRHAAWIVVLADMSGEDFLAVLEAVRNT